MWELLPEARLKLSAQCPARKGAMLDVPMLLCELMVAQSQLGSCFLF